MRLIITFFGSLKSLPQRKALLFVIMILPCAALFSQTLARNDQMKFDADYYLMEKDFNKALTNYLNILKTEPDNADIKYKAGICYLNSEDNKSKAIPYLEDAALKISEKYNPSSFKEENAPVDALFLLGSAYRVNNQIDQAVEAYNKYKNFLDPKDEYNLSVVDQYLKSCEMARSMQQHPVGMVSVNLGSTVNNEAPNFNAVVSGDGKTMLYTSPARQGYDIFMTTLSDSSWSTPRNITSVLGTGKYMMTSDLSYDGLTLLMVLDDPMNKDIFISRFGKGRWSKAESLGKEINTKYNETHASLSPDGKTLYFTSARKGGIGDLDIYRAVDNGDGSWGKPVNLGPEINTIFDEETPFLTKTGNVLYFSSKGHNGIGGYDIFYYDFDHPEQGVVNAGYPLNTTDNDLFYVPTGDGNSAYYSFRGEDSYGGRDIYKVFVQKPQPKAEEIVADITSFPSDTIVALDFITEVVPEPAISQEPEVFIDPLPTEPPPATEPEQPEALEEPVVPEPIAAEEPPVETFFEEKVVAASTPEYSFRNSSAYKVQIMALRKPVDLAYFKGLTGLAVVYNGDNWYRYILGQTPNRQEAEKLLTEVVTKGYKDAFIKAMAEYPQYTIQFMAVPGPVVDLKRFRNLSDVSVIRGNDNFCRYTTGEYATKEEAIAALEKVRLLGYKKAFVTRM